MTHQFHNADTAGTDFIDFLQIAEMRNGNTNLLGSFHNGGGTITSLDGGIPTVGEARSLIEQAGGTVLRVEGGHLPPNPHTFSHINYLTKNGLKGTIQIMEP